MNTVNKKRTLAWFIVLLAILLANNAEASELDAKGGFDGGTQKLRSGITTSDMNAIYQAILESKDPKTIFHPLLKLMVVRAASYLAVQDRKASSFEENTHTDHNEADTHAGHAVPDQEDLRNVTDLIFSVEGACLIVFFTSLIYCSLFPPQLRLLGLWSFAANTTQNASTISAETSNLSFGVSNGKPFSTASDGEAGSGNRLEMTVLCLIWAVAILTSITILSVGVVCWRQHRRKVFGGGGGDHELVHQNQDGTLDEKFENDANDNPPEDF